MPSSVVTGSVIAGFRVKSQIGAGAMGSVYLAEDTQTGMPVALKLLAPELAADERFRQRFARESALAATLDHPHVVEIVGSGDADGVLFLAMAYIDGPDLREVIRGDGPLEPERAVRLVEHAAAALDAAHAAGLVHRDVKPGNILVERRTDGEHAYVCDFGLARHVSSVSSLTGERGFVGTIDYISPEQIEGRAIDRRTDVYSLGCVLFECLTGTRPFERESELSVVFAHLNEPPPRISDIRPELPPAFDEVFAVALAKAPQDRYQTCGDLVAAAHAALAGKVLALDRRARRRRRMLVGGAVLVAAATATAGGFLATRGGQSHTPRPTLPTPGLEEITQTTIGDAPTGRTAAFYKKHFGGYRESTIAGPDYPTLAFQQPQVAVYFSAKGKPAIIITTWNRSYKTAKGIGPCSTIAEMKKAYGSAVKGSWAGTDPHNHNNIYSYVVGNNLLFATQDQRTISAVALYRGTPGNTHGGSPQAYANYIAANETACISG